MASTNLTSTQAKTNARQGVEDVTQEIREELREIGGELSIRVQDLLEQNRSRWLVIRQGRDNILLQIPLMLGLVAGVIFVMLTSSKRALLVAVAALFANIHLSVADDQIAEDEAPVVVRSTNRSRRNRSQ